MAIDAKIRGIIDQAGYIRVDEFMQEVLSNNKASYYRYKSDIGAGGDFITAPEVSQLFSEIVGLWVVDQWQKLGLTDSFCLVELGPGQGTMMKGVLKVASLVPELINNVEIILLDINPNLMAKQQEKLKNYQVSWISNIKDIPKKPAIIISNEFFDALPIRQYTYLENYWYESIIICDPISGELRYDKMRLGKDLASYLAKEHKNAHDGAVIEESLVALETIRCLAEHLTTNKGSCLTIDYGYNVAPADRTRYQYNSTLQAIKNHQFSPLFSSLGEADLSSHVDFYALKTALLQRGIQGVQIATQREFLLKYGIITRYEMLAKNADENLKNVLSKQLHRLIDFEQMGDLFKVMEFSQL